jgi:hypothetical protein
MVMTSTLRQDKEEEVQEGGEADVGAAEGGGVKV